MVSRLFAVLVACACALLTSCGSQQSASLVMKVGQVLPASHPTSKAMAFFAERLEALAGDRIDVRLYASGQLGSADQLITLTTQGNLEATVVSAAVLAQYEYRINVLTLPFIFRDPEHQYAVVDGPVGERLRNYLRTKELHAAGYFDSGSRNVMTKAGPVLRPEDLRGQKIRVMSSTTLQKTVAAIGAAPQAMSQGEVYAALQAGVIDGWENNPATCLAFSMYETGCVHFAWTRHVAIPDLLLISHRWYERLDEDLRALVDRAVSDTVTYQRELWQSEEIKAIAALEAAGMRFNEVEQSAFSSRCVDIYDAFKQQYGAEFAELLDMIRAPEQGAQP